MITATDTTIKITQIQFTATLEKGARAVSTIFESLPPEGREAAWLTPEAAQAWCEEYPYARYECDRPRVGNVRIGDEGTVTIVTPTSGREVAYCPDGGLWTVDFPGGSTRAAGMLLSALYSAGARLVTLAHREFQSDLS